MSVNKQEAAKISSTVDAEKKVNNESELSLKLNRLEAIGRELDGSQAVLFKKEQTVIAATWYLHVIKNKIPFVQAGLKVIEFPSILTLTPEQESTFIKTLSERLWNLCHLPFNNIDGQRPIKIPYNSDFIKEAVAKAKIAIDTNQPESRVQVYLSNDGQTTYEFLGKVGDCAEMLAKEKKSEVTTEPSNRTSETVIEPSNKKLKLSNC